MALYCSRSIFEALDGLHFPATKEDLLDFAEFKDAPESVVVVLNELEDKAIYHDIAEVCENARTVCNYELVQWLAQAPFPAKRDALLEFADRHGAPPAVVEALMALPSGYTYSDLDEMCEVIL